MYQVLCQRNRDESTGLPLKKEKEKKTSPFIRSGWRQKGKQSPSDHQYPLQRLMLHCLGCDIYEQADPDPNQEIQGRLSEEGNA